jgi:hypothetical protein
MRLLITIFATTIFLTATTATSDIVVLGDSLSTPLSGGTTSWPVEIFGEESYVNLAVGGASTIHFLNAVDENENSWWLSRTAPGDIWYIMLGNNDTHYDQFYTVERYGDRIIEIIDLTEASTVYIVASPGSPNPAKQILFEEQLEEDLVICDMFYKVYCINEHFYEIGPEHFKGDLVHLNDEGQILVAEFVPEPSAGLSRGVGLLTVGLLKRRRQRK